MLRNFSKLSTKCRFLSTKKPAVSVFRYTWSAAFGKYLFITNSVSCGVFMFVGDLIEQRIERYQANNIDEDPNKLRYDKARLERMLIVGMSMGPVHHYYYQYVNKLWPNADLISVGKKILADQLLMSPLCIAQFFYTCGLLEAKTLTECNEEFREKFLTVYKLDWVLWPAAQFLNFYFIPYRFQVLYINGVTVLYNIFLSYIKHTAYGSPRCTPAPGLP